MACKIEVGKVYTNNNPLGTSFEILHIHERYCFYKIHNPNNSNCIQSHNTGRITYCEDSWTEVKKKIKKYTFLIKFSTDTYWHPYSYDKRETAEAQRNTILSVDAKRQATEIKEVEFECP